MGPAHRSRSAIKLVLSLALGSLGLGVASHAATPVVPREPIILFDGKTVKDLSKFYTWLAEHGRDKDPNHVFSVVDQIDGAPAIRVSGQDWGGFVTREDYADYKLVTEFRWGLTTWGTRKDRTRDSGILLHGQGEDGNARADFRSPWFASIEYQIIEGGTGDVILVNGFKRNSQEKIVPRVTYRVRPGENPKRNDWHPQGTPTEFTSGRINWYGRDPNWKDVLGYRGPQDVEKPVGEWNVIEIIVKGRDLVYFLNGVKVHEGTNSSLTSGRLLFQSEGAEIYFRRIELHPVK